MIRKVSTSGQIRAKVGKDSAKGNKCVCVRAVFVSIKQGFNGLIPELLEYHQTKKLA